MKQDCRHLVKHKNKKSTNECFELQTKNKISYLILPNKKKKGEAQLFIIPSTKKH